MIWKYKEKKDKEWKLGFAFFPKAIGPQPLTDGQQIVWLEFVEMKWLGSLHCPNYEYRLPEKKVA